MLLYRVANGDLCYQSESILGKLIVIPYALRRCLPIQTPIKQRRHSNNGSLLVDNKPIVEISVVLIRLARSTYVSAQ